MKRLTPPQQHELAPHWQLPGQTGGNRRQPQYSASPGCQGVNPSSPHDGDSDSLQGNAGTKLLWWLHCGGKPLLSGAGSRSSPRPVGPKQKHTSWTPPNPRQDVRAPSSNVASPTAWDIVQMIQSFRQKGTHCCPACPQSSPPQTPTKRCQPALYLSTGGHHPLLVAGMCVSLHSPGSNHNSSYMVLPPIQCSQVHILLGEDELDDFLGEANHAPWHSPCGCGDPHKLPPVPKLFLLDDATLRSALLCPQKALEAPSPLASCPGSPWSQHVHEILPQLRPPPTGYAS